MGFQDALESYADYKSAEKGIDVAGRYDKQYAEKVRREQYEVAHAKNKTKRVIHRRHLNPKIKKEVQRVARNATLATVLTTSVISGLKGEGRSTPISNPVATQNEGIKIEFSPLIYRLPQANKETNPQNVPNQESSQNAPSRIENKEVDVMEIRAQLINKLLPGITDSEFMKIYQQIDDEMEGRELKYIDGILQDYGSFIKMNAREFNIPEWVIFGMLGTESRFDPGAEPPDSEAVGIAQITKIAGIDMGIVDDARGMDLRDVPSASIRGLALYISKYRTYFGGDLAYGIQTYKTGPGDLGRYGSLVTEKETARDVAVAKNVYSVISQIPDEKLKDKADRVYLARVIGHGAELQTYLAQQSQLVASAR